jgi:hypothetical protein
MRVIPFRTLVRVLSSLACAIVLVPLPACGGATAGSGDRIPDDAGTSDSGAARPREDAPGPSGCIADPVVNDACDPSVPACTPGNLCCSGAWTCLAATHTWGLERGECACAVDAGGPPADAAPPTVDATPTDASQPPTTCTAPASPDGGSNRGCQEATCPAGTVCVQRDADVTSTAMCVSIPPACHGAPTCACMGPEAQQCIGVPPQTDATPSFLNCEDETTGGTTFLDFPCGCA